MVQGVQGSRGSGFGPVGAAFRRRKGAAEGVRCYHEGMSLDERAFFTEKPETRQGRYQCPKCRRTGDYSIRWVRRAKKDRLPPGADDGDRAKFAKLRDYLLRLDDEVTCKTCGKKFEIPSQHSLMFVDQLAGPAQRRGSRTGDRRGVEETRNRWPRASRRSRRASRASRPAGSSSDPLRRGGLALVVTRRPRPRAGRRTRRRDGIRPRRSGLPPRR